jgi:hypothetical protein
MSVLDRMHNRERTRQQAEMAGESPENGQSSTLAVKPPVIQRLEYVVNTLHEYIEENDDTGTMARFSYVTRAMIEEVGQELADRDEETLQGFMAQIGEVIAWIGHGDPGRLPENLQDFVQPKAAIEAAS